MISLAPTVLLEDPAVIVGSWRELQVVVWRTSSTLPVLKNVIAAQRATPGRKHAILTVMDAGSLALPDAAMRTVMDEHRRATKDSLKAEAVVLPSGLVAATVRSVIAGITLVQRPPYPTRVVASLDEALAFLVPILEPVDGRAVTVAQLRAVVEAVRSPAPR